MKGDCDGLHFSVHELCDAVHFHTRPLSETGSKSKTGDCPKRKRPQDLPRGPYCFWYGSMVFRNISLWNLFDNNHSSVQDLLLPHPFLKCGDLFPADQRIFVQVGT